MTAPWPDDLVIDARALAHLYDGGRGLQHLDLQAGPGEAVALLGHNGSGKSTALDCIAGRLTPSAGTVRVCGADPQIEPEAIVVRRALAFASDAPVFYRSFTVAEHLELVGAAHGVIEELGRGAWSLQVDGVLRDFGLAAHRDARPDQLSAGLRQRTQLACAFARLFDVLLLDEPTLRLDPAGQRFVLRRIQQAVADGATALVTSHSIDFVADIADRVVILEDGSVADAGGWDEVRVNPAAMRLGLTTC